MADETQTRPTLPPPFRKGAPVRASEFEQIRGAVAFALKSMIGAGPGIIVSRRGDKYLISATARDNSSKFRHPFQVSIASLADAAAPTANIQASSRLYTNISTTATTITNLTTAFTLASNTCVWVQATVSALAVTAASRQTGTSWPSLVFTSGSPAAQTQFNIPIGRVVASDPTKPGFEFAISGTAYHFEQCLTSHLLVEARCNNGTTIIYAFPWGGAA